MFNTAKKFEQIAHYDQNTEDTLKSFRAQGIVLNFQHPQIGPDVRKSIQRKAVILFQGQFVLLHLSQPAINLIKCRNRAKCQQLRCCHWRQSFLFKYFPYFIKFQFLENTTRFKSHSPFSNCGKNTVSNNKIAAMKFLSFLPKLV